MLQKFSVSTNPSTCNEGLPNDSVYHRFLFLLQVHNEPMLVPGRCRRALIHPL